ncbi:DUF3145 family protein, partial [Nocardia otitidiscaviarum]|uniref:DUF3145 family protein n=1 Tax=Nocardia otitidiscaviarum TaxID=1823 RepID=UPI003CC7F9CA
CPHIEWTLTSTLKAPAKLRWTAQPAADGQLRATIDWYGPVGTLLVSGAALLVYYMLDYPPIGLALPVAAALFSAAERGRPPPPTWSG